MTRAVLASAVAAGTLLGIPSAPASATPTSCQAAGTAGHGGFLGPFTQTCQVASTVPAKGDLNPYGVAVVPATVGSLTAGDVLVSNFNGPSNLQGTGTTIMEVSPAGTATVFSDLAPQTTSRVGLTTALAVFRDGYVVVGSLPTTDGTAATAGAGALYVLDSSGRLVETLTGNGINGPWDMAAYDGGGFGVLMVTNVLNGTVAGGGSPVYNGTVERLVLDLRASPPALEQHVIVGSGFAEETSQSALVVGPTGVAIGSSGTVYVADTLANRLAAIPDGLFRSDSAGRGRTVSTGRFLSGPLGLAVAPDGDLLSANGGNGQIVETTPRGAQIEWPTVDSSGSPPGAGALFGLAPQPGGKGLYFVDDATNTLDVFK